ncbi:AMP-binding enzyme family protein (macronuclear) [Tetrahymena thermophila SB210]|uniref:AMP-binding enzyme family protein n=1 Tax=Tetrahymena thermophila (strain SB210) TaxID=312017 RepID=W7X9E8_TETTS|nr:AMP-binding enzyme family protein [Tetrahymena thermophila SB210]EWS73982.1 AMP-binding enzyme family protein [Tetrahymena thermophila SB210]|eukprot:XP_012653485.1 AMP-binding enzyme family protein [Tetrahymena thermophila SB210]
MLVNNQIDPKFRSQSFLMNDSIEISLNQDLIAFLFNYNQTLTMDQLQEKQNKTYLVYYAQFFNGDPNNQQLINLDIIQCSHPKLNGFKCIDFSKISNYSLIIDNSKSISSQIQIYIYGCYDLDDIKTSIPNNCAPQTDIDNAINGAYSFLQLKMQIQQYNTTSKELQTDYRRMSTFLFSNQFILTNVKIQKQETQVSKGLIFQTKQSYSSPIQFDSSNQIYDRQLSLKSGIGPYNQVSISLDEILQQFQIQYPTLIEILALVNSVAALVMIGKFLGKISSQSLIRKDFFMLILRNLFQDKNEKILKHNNLISQNSEIIIQQQSTNQDDNILQQEKKSKNKNKIFVPSFQTKFRDFVEANQLANSNCEYQFNLQQQQSSPENKKVHKDSSIVNQLSLSEISTIPYQNQQSRFNKNVKKQQLNTNNMTLQMFSPLSLNESERQIFQKKDNQNLRKLNSQKQETILKQDFIDSQSNDTIQKNQNYYFFSDTITEKLKAKNSTSMKKAVQNFIFKFKLFKQKEFRISKGIDENLMKIIGKEVDKHLNIFDLYEDIMFLKKAILMLLRGDQLAAIQLIGLTDDYINLNLSSDSSSKINFDQNKNKLSHFEKQYIILQSDELQKEYIKKFFLRCQKDKNVSKIDARLFSSLNKK